LVVEAGPDLEQLDGGTRNAEAESQAVADVCGNPALAILAKSL
jgi:hypothetical protein